jgi:tetratricopeptide (TPR) repeat protein
MLRFARHRIGLFLCSGLLLWGCSNTRDGRVYRLYHNVNARYNGFFYATEAMREAQERLDSTYVENYDEILPIFIEVDSSTAKTVEPHLERAIEKCTRVVGKHTLQPARSQQKNIKWPELNRFIDDNYDVIGRAHLMLGDLEKAEEVFQYLVRTLDYDDAQAWSNAWLARAYMAQGDQVRANNALMKAASFRATKDEVRSFVGLVQATYYLKYEQLDQAILRLEDAVKYLPKGMERARPTFILAQCLEAAGRSAEAIERYKEVVDMRTPYELEFYAKIRQAMAFDRRGGSSEPIVALLEEMLESKKNEQYRDQIYYALAELALEERRVDDGFALLKLSLREETGNDRQRMKGYLKLGDLYMGDLDYVNAQAYYDSAVTYLPSDHPRHAEVNALAKNLTDLVRNLQIIEEQDSLLALCDLDEGDRLARLDQIVADLEAEAERQRLAAEEAARREAEGIGTGGEGMFWPYNAQLKATGRRNFQDYWGDRPLEDHWRRSRKMASGFSETAEETEEEGAVAEGAPTEAGKIPTRDELLAGLPCEPEQRAEALAKIAEAYYNAGLDYKEKLSDPPNAILSWQTLLERFEESDFHPTAHYQLFRTYLQREIEENYQNPFCGTCNSEHWAAEILRRYPGSEWAVLVENPDFADEEEVRREAERVVYEGHLMRYYDKQYQSTLLAVSAIIESEPENHFLCKYRLLKAQCVGGLSAVTRDRLAYFEALYAVVDGCPETEEATFALELLTALGGLREPEGGVQADTTEQKTPEIYAHKPYLEHYFAIVVPVGRGNPEQVKGQISDYNAKNHLAANLRITANLLDRSHQIILVKSFRRQDYGMTYYEAFTTNREALTELNASGYDMFLISSENYVELFKSKKLEEYKAFFAQYYLTAGR